MVSVIVPVYNAEQYLDTCIKSILSQTYSSYEVLLINDGSSDRSGEICEDIARKDSRIKVFHKINGGVSSARNVGLDNARGDWIAFVDADDEVTSEYLNVMVSKIPCDNSLIMQGIKGDRRNFQASAIVSGADMITYIVDNHVMSHSGPVCKLFCRSILEENHIRFPLNVHMGEDAIFMLKYLNKVNNLSVVNNEEYIYRDTCGSLSAKYYPFESEWRCYYIWKNELLSLLNRWPVFLDPIEIAWKNRIATTFSRCLQCGFRQSKGVSISQQIKDLKGIPQKDYDEYRKYYNPELKRRKFQKYLIVHKLYVLYVILGRLEFLLKYGR